VTDSQSFIAGKRCLVVDDEFLIALDIQQALEGAGAVVTSIGDAGPAMDALRGGARFDIAVLDIKLTGPGDSMALAALLTERRIPFIFLTGMRADSADAQRYPNAPVVEKPFQLELLVEALRQALRA
jgi:CheY-like chemotaxis protein